MTNQTNRPGQRALALVDAAWKVDGEFRFGLRNLARKAGHCRPIMAKVFRPWYNRLTLAKWGINYCLVFITLTGSLQSFEAEAATDQPAIDPAVKTRLSGGDGHQGILERYDPRTRSWYPFCGNENRVDKFDADVACRELGFHGAQEAGSTPYFLEDRNHTAFINIWCQSAEGTIHTSLEQCSITDTGDATICDQLAATVTCLTTRLTGGEDGSEGRVEVWSDGNWGKVCSPGFGGNEQTVVCHELGYKYKKNLTHLETVNQFRDLSRPYMWGSVSCTGSEPNLLACNPTTTAPSSCDEKDDAYAICTNTLSYTEIWPPFSVRLVDGPCKKGEEMEGRLEVYDGSRWGTVCQDMFTEKDAEVVCRQLGLRTVSAKVVRCCDTYPKARVGTNVVLGHLNCTGSEIMIGACPHPPIGSTAGCSSTRHSVDVGVRCQRCPQAQGVNIGAVIGGAIAVVFILIVIGVVVWYVCCIPTSKYHKRQADEPENDDDDDDDKFRKEATPDDPMLTDDLDEEDLRERTTEMDTGV